MTKSAMAVPGRWLGQVSTVKMLGSWRGTSQMGWVFLMFHLCFTCYSTETYTMIEAHRVDGVEIGQVVLVGYVVAMPGDHIEGTVLLCGHKQMAEEFRYDLILSLNILEMSFRREKVTWIGQSIGANGAQVG